MTHPITTNWALTSSAAFLLAHKMYDPEAKKTASHSHQKSAIIPIFTSAIYR
jgi:hypothetical protein